MQSPVAKIAENAALLCTHLPKSALADFIPFTEQLLKRSLSPLTTPQRRLLFTFLLRLFEHHPPTLLTPSHLQLYDDCLQRIAAPDRSCIPALCMKIAAVLTYSLPEIREGVSRVGGWCSKSRSKKVNRSRRWGAVSGEWERLSSCSVNGMKSARADLGKWVQRRAAFSVIFATGDCIHESSWRG